MITEANKSLTVNCLKVSQPMGDFFVASIPAKDLVNITYFDVRRVLIAERDVERYLGVQRPLNTSRVKTISSYVRTSDACFPTGIIIAVPAKCAAFDEKTNQLTLSNFLDSEDENEFVLYRNIARVLDGQHRLAGLEDFEGTFDLNVSIFVDADIADQASIFSTVNLAQTKVSKSLAYDLYDLMKSRSPQKTCHNITVTLDRETSSPFYKMIKRLGIATEGRKAETLTQATFIEPFIRYLSVDQMADRDAYLRGRTPQKVSSELLLKHPFQHMFVDENDFEITDIIWNYFDAVKERWPEAWASRNKGVILNRTNGYRALMRFLRPLYLNIASPGQIPEKDKFLEVLRRVDLKDQDFNTENFQPGSSGEGALYKKLMSSTDIIEPKHLRQGSLL